MADQKSRRISTISTQGLKPGDHVTGSERWEVMLPPAGLYVAKIVNDDIDKTSPTYGCTLIFWSVNPNNPEAFNPYYSWYVDNRCEKCNEPDPHNCLKEKEKHHGKGQDPQEE
jgi:hypothetical protein